MISISLYKILHLLGVFMVLMGVSGSLVANSIPADQQQQWKKRAGLFHGVGLLIVLVAGFGLLARLGHGLELWVALKLLIWLALGAIIVLVRRLPQQGGLLWVAILVLATLAASLGQYKPS